MRKSLLAGCAALLLLTGGCAGTGQQQQIGTVIGGVLGAAGGNVAGKSIFGRRNGRTMGTIIGGGAGALLGGSIGRLLDERDQARAEAATLAVLRHPLPPSYYQSNYAPAPGRYPARSTPPISRGTQRAPSHAQQDTEPPLTSGSGRGRLPSVPRAASEQWVSDHSGATGSATVVGATPATANRGECRTVQTTAQKAGQRQTSTDTLCESSAGADDWQKI